ncbi:uncharacterized protein BYT42DRAFT_580545 [Radiomyces spectabilis]|uniref:uncharacterized protein n=1 Tax=Radiomyces spectabilis TaxID=64574 RepID=UPI00221F2F23|nr:uncharacterized protein BYT42DRAFT_580545 [Radiomyces spectabilis]KAI8371514.1 hypothetical protein BYT42DRAFT_580545 [Radiomyces spectabilis]
MFSEKNFHRGMGVIKKTLPRSRLSMVSDNYDEYDEEEEEEEEVKPVQPSTAISSTDSAAPLAVPPLSTEPTVTDNEPSRKVDIKQLFPDFEKDKILKFSDLFMARIQRPSKLQPVKLGVLSDNYEYEMEADDRVLFTKTTKRDRNLRWMAEKTATKRRRLEREILGDGDHVSSSESEDDQYDTSDRPLVTGSPSRDVRDNRLYHSIVLDQWEDHIQWGDESDRESQSPDDNLVVNKHLNERLEAGDWLDAIIWDKEKPNEAFMKISLDLNDPNMLFDCEEVEATKAQLIQPKHVKRGRKPLPRPLPKIPIIYPVDTEPHSKLPLNRFNLSNDKYYESHYTGRLVRVRQTLGQLVVQHSLPALRLHPAFYKTKLSKAEARSFHRPLVQLPLNHDITFSRVRISKKNRRKDKKKNAAELMRSTKDLSLKDNSMFVLLEFSEEHPPIISNVGMGTLIINYYRKTDPKDEFVPSLDIGEPFVLDIGDTSPFMNFGNVEPGQTITVLYNNLIRAPLFRHEVKNTDFLMVKSTYKGNTKYYIREIPATFVVGQTYPVQEVPGPHSRKITTTIRNRLQIVAYRLIKKNPLYRLKMSRLAQKFPEYSDIQIRQRLKEFLEFHRRNKEGGGGYWTVRGGGEAPSEEDLQKMVTPEMICLYESMLVGERHLQDLGYGDINDEDETGEGDSKLEVEQQLAPWFATRNFINASQGKAMLKLYGAGDPTGRGEGFSFIRVSMKDIFLRAGESAEEKLAQIEARPKSAHRYNVAEQQQIYKEEIHRIWNAQLDSLSNPVEPELSDHEGEEDSEFDDHTERADSPAMSELDWNFSRRSSRPVSMSPMPPSYNRRYERAPSESVDDDDISVTGSLSSRTSYHVNNPNKYLVIRRLIRQPNGEKSWQQEVVRDPVVIKSYLRQRQMIEEEATSAEALEPTDDAEKNARMKKRIQDQLAKLKRNAERRRQRQLAKQAALAENPVLGLIRGKREGAMRRCGNCGQLGHMKTNKNCPMFYVVNNPNNNATPAAAPGDTPGSNANNTFPGTSSPLSNSQTSPNPSF